MYRASLAALPHRAKVAARAKSAPRAGDHNDSDGVIPRDAPQRLVKRRGQLVVQRIQTVGAIHH